MLTLSYRSYFDSVSTKYLKLMNIKSSYTLIVLMNKFKLQGILQEKLHRYSLLDWDNKVNQNIHNKSFCIRDLDIKSFFSWYIDLLEKFVLM